MPIAQKIRIISQVTQHQAQRSFRQNTKRGNDIEEAAGFPRNTGFGIATTPQIDISHHPETARKKLLNMKLSLN